MRIVEFNCGEGCLTVLEGNWFWLLVMKIADRIPSIPWRIWSRIYDHLDETTWRPGHIGDKEEPSEGAD